ncbi:hypothetical protein BCR44DRAFT_1535325 [Catenaria anguillulae PL171]|uniref:RGS domain-containing protein n=1 Tax=Catenaria anguillulae PL171 TaxID=765915 RepID=A0A1Y2HF61_9FUNG|nr:hypothetical protein BCR44DRAFT_1535325 [Catenaria anguillulae PL171]
MATAAAPHSPHSSYSHSTEAPAPARTTSSTSAAATVPLGPLMGAGTPSSSTSSENMYKRRQSTKAKKLLQFFGSTPPVDVSVDEVISEGFKAIVHSKLPLCYFLHALLDDYASENLFFVLEVERYEATPFTDAQSHLQAAYAVFETYLGRGAYLEVNIDDRVRRHVISELARLGRAWATIASQQQQLALNSPASANLPPPSSMAAALRSLFDPAKSAVMLLLESSYAKFTRSSPLYPRMVRELRAATVVEDHSGAQMYTADAKHAALLVLAEYMHREGLVAQPSAAAEAALDRSPSPPVEVQRHGPSGGSGHGSAPSSSVSSPNERTREVDLASAANGSGGMGHLMDPQVRKALLRRMLQGFAITMLGADLVQYAQQATGSSPASA